ncbi:sugar ABC transporter substrate-binding protein [Solicola sp. PLA-1-18]|uniref:sugar ABC transporter substrate-binding protein n=1 Tax=Solicola sp. PLA-1-18 TaxID=3380532 RepID=UPI003B7B4245
MSPHVLRRPSALAALLAAGALTLTACGGSSFDDSGSGESGGDLSVLIGSSGDAETKAVESAVAAWAKESGTGATVTTASDLPQQLSQGFASGDPADVFYVASDTFAGYADNGSLEPYAQDLPNIDDFYPTLTQAFTYDDQVFCAPKDFSTLGLVINSQKWSEAGLTDADVPKTWDDLASVAKTLTKGDTVGLSISPEYARVGAFMAQAGGGLLNDDQTKATADSDANVEGLNYVKSLLSDGSLKFTTDIGAGWGGEAFGKGQAAMTIEGNWIRGGLENDFPDVEYQVAELPAGPAGQATLQFTNCWGIAADSDNKPAARELVEKLTSQDDQLGFAKAFGVMPSIESGADPFKTEYPEDAAFVDSAAFAKNVPTLLGSKDVIDDLNSKLPTLADSDPKTILATTQKDLESVVADSQ